MRLFTTKELRIITVVVAVATIVAVTITVVRESPKTRESIPTEISTSKKFDLLISDMIIPEDYTEEPSSRWYLSRPPLRKWSEEQIARYWIDPRQIGIEILEKENDRLIEEMFEDVQ